MSSGTAGAAVTVVNDAAADELMVCANCGIAQVDDIKLEECDGCDLVKYCSNLKRTIQTAQRQSSRSESVRSFLPLSLNMTKSAKDIQI